MSRRSSLFRYLLPTLGIVLAATAAQAKQWSTDHLSLPRNGLAAAAAGTKVLFAGGETGAGRTATVDVYDTVTGTWSIEQLSLARHVLGGASLGDLAIFAGGNTGPGSIGSSDRVDIYDASTDTWSTASISIAAGTVRGTSIGTKAFFASESPALEIYDASTDTWSTEQLPNPGRVFLTVASVGTKVFIAGGRPNFAPTDIVDIWDDATGTWSTATLSEPRYWLASTGVGSKVLFAGGVSPNGRSDVVDIYDDATGTWSVATLSKERRLLEGVTLGNLAIFAGGQSQSGDSDVVDIYDDAAGLWTTAKLSAARDLAEAAVALGGSAYFAGGNPQFFGRSDVVDVFTPSLGVNYCRPANPNTTGFPSTMSVTGSRSIAVNDVTLAVHGLPLNAFGYFLTSQTQDFVANPGGSQGNLCLGGAIGRYVGPGQIQNSGATGSYELTVDLALTPSPTGFVQAAPGETWFFQSWHRDSVFGAPLSNFTDGIWVTFEP